MSRSQAARRQADERGKRLIGGRLNTTGIDFMLYALPAKGSSCRAQRPVGITEARFESGLQDGNANEYTTGQSSEDNFHAPFFAIISAGVIAMIIDMLELPEEIDEHLKGIAMAKDIPNNILIPAVLEEWLEGQEDAASSDEVVAGIRVGIAGVYQAGEVWDRLGLGN